MIFFLRLGQHRARRVYADNLSARRECARQSSGAAPQIERALEWRQQRLHKFEFTRVDPRAARAAKTQRVIITRDLGLGVKRALGL